MGIQLSNQYSLNSIPILTYMITRENYSALDDEFKYSAKLQFYVTTKAFVGQNKEHSFEKCLGLLQNYN